jgi:hypothetical protein
MQGVLPLFLASEDKLRMLNHYDFVVVVSGYNFLKLFLRVCSVSDNEATSL